MALRRANIAMLTLLFGIFILFATQVLSLVPTLCLNH